MKGNTMAIKPEDDYQAQADMRTLHEAEKIKADKKRHTKAKAHAKEMLKSMSKVAEEGDPNEKEPDNDADDK